jgi:hypothetical protein
LKKTIKWIEEADFEAKIVIAGECGGILDELSLTLGGNHDITLDTDFYNQYGMYFHNQNPEDPAKCQELLEQAPSILWLKHEHAVINLVSPSGPQTTFKIFGSPFSPARTRQLNYGIGYPWILTLSSPTHLQNITATRQGSVGLRAAKVLGMHYGELEAVLRYVDTSTKAEALNVCAGILMLLTSNTKRAK